MTSVDEISHVSRDETGLGLLDGLVNREGFSAEEERGGKGGEGDMSVSGWGMNTRPETSQAMGNEEGDNKEMSGWLWSREAKNGRNWQRRWCVVQSGLLEVYSSHVMLKMVTCIPLDDCTVEKVMSSRKFALRQHHENNKIVCEENILNAKTLTKLKLNELN